MDSDFIVPVIIMAIAAIVIISIIVWGILAVVGMLV